jgi:hypothetical protein
MAQVLSVGDTMVVTIVTAASDIALNRLAYEITALVSGAPTDQDFVTAFSTAIATDWRALLGSNCVYEGCIGTLHAFGTPTPFAKVESTAGTGAGTFGSNMSSAQTAGLIAWHTPRAGPAHRGRMYVPGVPQGAYASNEKPSVGYQTALDTFAANILNFTLAASGGRSASCQFCLRNRTGTLQVVTGFASRPKWATQKRRGDYGRPTGSPL